MSAPAAQQLDPSTIVSTIPAAIMKLSAKFGSHLPLISPSPCVKHVSASPRGRRSVWKAASRLWGQWCPYSRSPARKPSASSTSADPEADDTAGQEIGQTARPTAFADPQHLTPLGLK